MHVDNVAADLRLALAALRRRRGFTVTAVLVLALGVGANTALFSVTDALLLRPLPFPSAERLVRLGTINDREGRLDGVSYADFTDWQSGTDCLERGGLFASRDVNLGGDGEPQRVTAGAVSAGLLEMFGVRPIAGRSVAEADTTPGHGGVVFLSAHVWHRRYAANHEALGRTLVLDGRPVEIAGVLPEIPIFRYVDVWVPLTPDPETLGRDRRTLAAYGRLRAGVTLERASAELTTVARTLEREYPGTNRGWRPTVRSLHDNLANGPRLALVALTGTGALVLLVACANVASLLTARGDQRRRELAIRRALGAGLGRLMRLLLAESLLLGLLGAVAAVLMSFWTVDALAAVFESLGPVWNPIEVNARVLAFALGISIGSVGLFGLAPAWLTARAAQPALLRTGSLGAPHARLRTLFTAAQFALATVLLTGSCFMRASVYRSAVDDRGFDPAGVLTFEVSLPRATYPTDASVVAGFGRLVASLARAAGVRSVGVTSDAPIVGDPPLARYTDGDRALEDAAAGQAALRVVGPGYLAALGIPVRAGRDVDARDSPSSEPVVVVNDALAGTLWPGASAIGRRVRLAGGEGPARLVIGVIPNVRQESGDIVRPESYVPLAQAPRRGMTVVARTRSDAGAGLDAIRAAVAAVDANLPVYFVRSLDEVLRAGVAERGLAAGIVGAFAAVATGLAAVGLGGLLFSLVAVRTQEIGVRLALGAGVLDVFRLMLNAVLPAAFAASGVGLLASVGLARMFQSAFYGVSATDFSIFASVGAAEIAVVLLISALPAYRAARIDPVTALHAE